MGAIILILTFNIYLTLFNGLYKLEKKQPTNFTKSIFCVSCINTFTWIVWSGTSLLRSAIFCSSVFTCRRVSAHDRVRRSSFIWMLTKANIGYSKKRNDGAIILGSNISIVFIALYCNEYIFLKIKN